MSTGQSFTITANLINSGEAGLEGHYKARLTLPAGQGYDTTDELDPRVLHNEPVQWTITAPLTARDANIFSVELVETPED